jgi:hypothetical protein
MDRVVETLWAIRKSPDDYLPERSIWALGHFLTGYKVRCCMEGAESEINPLIRRFQAFLDDHFSIQAGSRSVFLAVDSFSKGPEDALWNFYRLFEQFLTAKAGYPTSSEFRNFEIPKEDLFALLRKIRERPELYVGYPHFLGVHAHIAGHLRAGADLGVDKTHDEVLFEDFKGWIEREKLSDGSPRPWFKLIEFRNFHDCGGTSPRSRYSDFFNFLTNLPRNPATRTFSALKGKKLDLEHTPNLDLGESPLNPPTQTLTD